MDEEIAEREKSNAEFYLATVTSRTSAGLRIKLDGQDSGSTKAYSQMYTCRSLQVGDRVVVMKQSGTYIVLGMISSSPQNRRYINKLSGTSTTVLKINEIIQLLWDLNIAVQNS